MRSGLRRASAAASRCEYHHAISALVRGVVFLRMAGGEQEEEEEEKEEEEEEPEKPHPLEGDE